MTIRSACGVNNSFSFFYRAVLEYDLPALGCFLKALSLTLVKLSTKSFSLLSELFSKVIAVYAIKTRVVLNSVCNRYLTCTHVVLFAHQCGKHCSACIYRCSKPRRTTAYYYNVIHKNTSFIYSIHSLSLIIK